jgi:hypothetical protein
VNQSRFSARFTFRLIGDEAVAIPCTTGSSVLRTDNPTAMGRNLRLVKKFWVDREARLHSGHPCSTTRCIQKAGEAETGRLMSEATGNGSLGLKQPAPRLSDLAHVSGIASPLTDWTTCRSFHH